MRFKPACSNVAINNLCFQVVAMRANIFYLGNKSSPAVKAHDVRSQRFSACFHLRSPQINVSSEAAGNSLLHVHTPDGGGSSLHGSQGASTSITTRFDRLVEALIAKGKTEM